MRMDNYQALPGSHLALALRSDRSRKARSVPLNFILRYRITYSSRFIFMAEYLARVWKKVCESAG